MGTGRWLSGESTCYAKYEDLNLTSNTNNRRLIVTAKVVNPRADEAELGEFLGFPGQMTWLSS